MVILSAFGHSAFRTEAIISIGFELKRDKNDKPFKDKKGIYEVDKTKLHIVFNCGYEVTCLCPDEVAGQDMFNSISEAMNYNR